jgi:hypothetical protein
VLRITIDDEPEQINVKLEGKLVGAWVAELDRTWRSLGGSLERKKLSIDLCGVTYIGRDGRGLLAEMYRQNHAHFKANTPLTQYFAEEARAGLKNGNGNGTQRGVSK